MDSWDDSVSSSNNSSNVTGSISDPTEEHLMLGKRIVKTFESNEMELIPPEPDWEEVMNVEWRSLAVVIGLLYAVYFLARLLFCAVVFLIGWILRRTGSAPTVTPQQEGEAASDSNDQGEEEEHAEEPQLADEEENDNNSDESSLGPTSAGGSGDAG
jgi:hypothetical protein